MFSNFHRSSLRCTRQVYDEAFAKKNRMKNWTSSRLGMVIGSARLLVPLCVTLHTMVKGRDHEGLWNSLEDFTMEH